MAENEDDNIERDEEFENNEGEQLENVIQVSGMYQEWFLDYASYVILERAVPHLNDGLKPVQRRILHSMKELDDGRYHKVANLIGNTMKYHPHGDASIGDAMVQIGQKDLLIDCQGNWGNIYTGDRAAAPRYIEARLTKFALDVVFNAKTTTWLSSYDGRNQEPETLPIKFPLLLAQGVEGIAVGLACKTLPHNFNELIDGSIAILKEKKTNILPDFPTGGLADFSGYNEGLRGSRVKIRARIVAEDKKTLKVTELPFGVTTDKLIESILKANSKNKIKVRQIEDNTAENVEILIHLPAGVSPDKTIDALYAFTDCEISISPNSTVIHEDKPKFIGVNELLEISTHNTVDLLRRELEIRKGELEDQWHFSSLEKIFIENKIYVKLHGLGYEEALDSTLQLLQPFVKHLLRPVTADDVVRLLEIRMRRITKHDADKADEKLLALEDELRKVKYNLEHLIEFAIEYFKEIKRKYGEGRDRKTEIRSFESIDAAEVAINNVKLYLNKEEGFIGHGLKRGEGDFVCDCSDIDDIIVFREDGKMLVTKITQKAFVGKNVIYAGVWKKDDKRTIYNLIYQDGKTGPAMMKRFPVTSITRDKEYDLTKGTAGSKILWFTANSNGEAETILVKLRPKPGVRKLKFEIEFSELAIKGRAALGNRVTKYPIAKIELKEKGVSTLSARKIWFDDTVQRLNAEGRGDYLGEFKPTDKILTIMQTGEYHLTGFDLFTKFDENMIVIEKWNPKKPVSAIYFDGDKKQYNVKRFLIEPSLNKVSFISEHPDSFLEVVSTDWKPQIQLNFAKDKGIERASEVINLENFIAIKGLKAIGNRLTTYKVKNIDLLEPLPYEEIEEISHELEEEGFDSEEDVDDLLDNDNLDLDDETLEDEKPATEIKLPSEEKKEKKGPIKPIIDDDGESQMTLF